MKIPIIAAISVLILTSYSGMAFAQFTNPSPPSFDPDCPSCLEIPDKKTLDFYKKTLPLVIWTDNLVPGGTDIELKGQSNLKSRSIPISITVFNPIGNVVTVDQLMANADGSFGTNIKTGGPLWTQDGPYTIKAQQGDNASGNRVVEIQVDIVDGAVVPEFGTVATLILVIAISSIIIISARGRLVSPLNR